MTQQPPFLIQHEGETYRLVSDSHLNDFLTRLYNLITTLLFSRKTWQSAGAVLMIYLAENAGYSDQMLIAIGGVFAVLIGSTAWEDVSKRTGTTINAGTVESMTTNSNTTNTPGTL